MANEKEAHDLVKVLNALGASEAPMWFVAFGALLWFIRDKNMGKPFKTDLDIAIIGGEPDRMVERMKMYLPLKRVIINNVSKQPFQAVFGGWCSVDVFFMFEENGLIWHTYDYKMEFPKNGIPSSYTFKGVSKSAFAGPIQKYLWNELIPPFNFPCKYGTLLDRWYENWFIPDSNFGQSHADKIITLPDCKHLEDRLK